MKKIFRLIREAWENIDSVNGVFEFLFGIVVGSLMAILILLLISLFVVGIFEGLKLIF